MTLRVERTPPGVRYRFAIPDGWTAFPAQAANLRPAVRRWLLGRLSHRSRDETVALRRRAEDELVRLAQSPGVEYAKQLLVLSLDVGQVPITATCLVALVPQHLPDDAALATLAAELAPPMGTAEVTQLGGCTGIVVVQDIVPIAREQQPSDAELADLLSRAGPPGRVSAEQVAAQRSVAERTRSVDVYLPVPESRQTLLLSFSTPVVALFGPLTELFVTVASTVQFQVGDDAWR
jgi:hypothetical protein